MTTSPVLESPAKSAPKKRGHPRKHPDNAAKQKDYNSRKREPKWKSLAAEVMKLYPVRRSQRAEVERQLKMQYPTIRKLKEFLRSLRRNK